MFRTYREAIDWIEVFAVESDSETHCVLFSGEICSEIPSFGEDLLSQPCTTHRLVILYQSSDDFEVKSLFLTELFLEIHNSR